MSALPPRLPASPAPSASGRTLHPTRRTLMRGAAWAAPTALMTVGAPAMAISNGGCQPEGTLFDAQSRGRLLSGAIGGANLDAVASVEGVHAQAVEGTPTDREVGALTVSALQAIQLNLGTLTGALSSILSIVAAQNSGLLNQYAWANEAVGGDNTAEVGASGAVSDSSGAINLDQSQANPPALGTIDLRSLLAQATGLSGVADLVASVSQLQLQLGAVAGIAEFDSLCVQVDEAEVDRDYLVAYLKLLVASDVVGGVLSALNTALPTLTVSSSAILGAIGDVGGALISQLLGLIGSRLTVQLTVNTAGLTQQPIPDSPNSALQLDLEEGTMLIDVATLLGGAYTGNISTWLNELPPNTRLFVDEGLPAGAVTSLLDTWVDTLLDRLKDLVSVHIVGKGLLGTTVLEISGTLREVLDGSATISVIGLNLGSGLLGQILAAVGATIESALDDLLNENAVIQSALEGTNVVLSQLFGVLEGVLAITLNAQNVATGSMPAYYQAIAPVGRYDVGALHLEILGIANLLNLSLGRGSVGENTPQ